ncbi:circadian clock-controlled protein daywake-like [Anthonomus grandis grandis]|uniref:circadian clock-controlled protein daywake-like n=1 Tax=Anthonomus grandis grandis TaxID=2921223 RepID=UPI0021662665|nr:circadian clock-controlled protein daywake-like [Anthonomus grandis grandis]
MYCKFICVLLLGSGVFIGAVQLPPEITKCKKSDSECMSKSIVQALQFFKNGNKELGFPKLQPFYLEKLEIEADPGKSVKLNQHYEKIYLHGMTNAEVKQFSLKDDGKTCKWEMIVYSPGTRMDADYKLTGQVLLFPINGYGRCNVTMQGISNKHSAECEHFTKKGKQHMRLKNYKMDMSVESCHFDFPNIIPGNEKISAELGKTVNENSLEIFKDVKGGFEEILSRLHESGANSIFAKIPEDELFLAE